MNRKSSKLTALVIATIFILSTFMSPALAYDKSNTTYVSGHAHIDTAWQWDYATSIKDLIFNTWTKQLNLLNKNPEYKFSASSAQHYEWAKEYYPSLFKSIKDKVAKDQWDIVGGQWVEAETSVQSGESMVRQFLEGQTFFKQEFGKKAEVAFLPDDPGHSWILPQIASKSGIKAFTSTRISALPGNNHYSTNGNKGYDNFKWKGVDGTEIMSYKPSQWYSSNMSEGDVNSSLDSPNEIGLNKSFFYYGDGDMGGGPTQAMIDAANAVNADPNQPTVKFSKMIDYFDSLTDDEKEKIPTFEDELYYNHELGLFTSHGDLKKYNNDNEISAEVAEKLSSIAMWSGAASYPAEKLDSAWKKILVNQQHDVLSGCIVSSAAHDAWTNEEIALNLLGETKNYAFAAVASRADTTGTGIPMVVFNPMSYSRTDIVDTSVTFDSTTPAAIKVYDPDGVEIPSQVTFDGNKAKVIFTAKDVPSVGYAVYHAVPAASAGTYDTGLSIGNNKIENDRYIVELNPLTGNVSRIFDKESSKEVLESGKEIELQKLEDTSKDGWESWIIDYDDLIAPPTIIKDNPQIELIEAGPIRATYQVTKHDGSSTFKQKITLYSDIDRVDFPMNVDWHESNKMIKASFPLAVSNPKATFDLSYGTVERGNRTDIEREVPAQKWADITDTSGDFGVSMLSECKYGWDKVNDNTLRLTLLRSPKDGVVKDYNMDIGVQNFTYSIYSHGSSWADGNTPQEANSMVKPLIAYQTVPHAGELGKSFSFVSVDKPNVMVTVVKKVEANDSNDLIFRLYESQGKSTDVNVTFAGKILSLSETNLIEEDIGTPATNVNSFNTSLHKYELKTFRANIESQNYSNTKPQVDSVDLSSAFNQDGMSYDSAKNDGNMDGAGRTLPAELIPSNIVSEDVSFTMGPKEDGSNNVVKAEGQTIPLNSGNYNELYILGTSIGGPQCGNFTVNYADNSSTTKTLKFNDWGATIGGFGLPRIEDKIGFAASHRHNLLGSEANKQTYLYVYKLALDDTKEVSNIILPDNTKMKILSMSLSGGGFLPAETNEVYPFTNDNTAMINDDSPQIIYSTGWNDDNNRGENNYNGDTHYAGIGSHPSLEFTFNGTGIEYITETAINEGDVDIYIDDMVNKVATISCQSADKISNQVVYSNNSLAQGQHKIKLVGVSGDWMMFDAFRVMDYEGSPIVVPTPPSDPEVTNDDSSKIRYTAGWNAVTNRLGAYNSDIHTTQTVGESCEFTFVGTDVEYYGETGPDMGEVEVYIDGQMETTVNTSSFNQAFFQTLYSRKGLIPGRHKIKLVMKSGSMMAVDGFKFANMPAPPAEATLINNNSSSIMYYDDKGASGGWGNYGDRGFGDFNDDVTATGSQGYYCELEFTGTGIYLFSETNSDEGNLDIYIDDVFDKTVSCVTASRIGAQQVYGKNGLAPGVHKIRVVNASDSWALIDAFKVSANLNGSVLGTVVDQFGKGVEGANVSMTVSGSAISVQTDAIGDYIISNVPAGTGYTLAASKVGYYSTSASAISIESDGLSLVDDITIVAKLGNVSGKVLDELGNGIEGATVSIDGTAYTAITDAAGEYTIPNVLIGTGYSVTVTKAGYNSGSATGIEVTEGATTTEGAITLTVNPSTGTVTGRIVDENGSGIEGVTVNVSVSGTVYTAITNATGNYTIVGIPAGTGYTIAATKAGYQSGAVTGIEVSAGGSTAADDITLTANPVVTTGTLTGRVVDGNGSAIQGATVTLNLNSTTYTATTSLTGYYTIANIPAGTGYTITVTKAGYQNGAVIGITVNKGVATTVDNVILIKNTSSDNGSNGGSNSSGSSSGSASPSTPVTPPAPTVSTNTDGNVTLKVEASLNKSTGVASIAVAPDSLKKAFDTAKADNDGIKTVVMPLSDNAKGAQSYEFTVPAAYVTADVKSQNLQVQTGVATVNIPNNMLKAAEVGNAANIVISIAPADISKLDAATKKVIGNKPVIDVTAKINDKVITWNNPEAPVTISIPYTPTEEELKNTENITVWYLDNMGNAVPVPSARYDSNKKAVTFSTTHFSKYVIAFVNMSFTDIPANSWMKNSVEVLASKGVIEGTDKTTFSPNNDITRGQFIMWLIKTLNLTATYKENFDDVKSTDSYYEQIGIAKQLGITSGVGNNKFNPDKKISRQDMMVLTVKAMKAANNKLFEGTSDDIMKFTDVSKVARYAANDVATMVKQGFIKGDGKNLKPTSTTTRAEAAAMLYNIYSKQ